MDFKKGSTKKYDDDSNSSLWFSSWSQNLGLGIEESLGEIQISTTVGRAREACFFKTRISRAREISPPAQGGASAANEPRHQVRWPET